jgi:peptide/nickel transport system permease protein
VHAAEVRLNGTLRAARPVSPIAALAFVIGGIGLVFVGTTVLDGSTALPRWVLASLGLGFCFRGLDWMGKVRFGRRFQTGVWLSGIWVGIVIVVAVIAPLLPIEGPNALPLFARSYVRPDLFSSHPLGTDGLGRDYVARLIWGARVSLIIGLGCTAVSLIAGSALGILGGYFRGRLEWVLMVVTDALLAFPPLVFLLALMSVLRPSLWTLFLAFVLLTVPTVIRLSRASTYVVAEREFVLAAKALGASSWRIMFREILPNVIRPLLSFSMVIVAYLIVEAAALSFLGLGIPPPSPSWGDMIAESQTVLQQDPQGVLIPAVILCMTVIAFNRLGEAGRQKADSRGSVLG